MCGPSKKTLYGVGFLSLIATVAYVIALSTPFMITQHTDLGFGQTYDQQYGWWRACVKSSGPLTSGGTGSGGSSTNCRNYDTNQCDLLPPHEQQSNDNCNQFQTVKSFAIMATISSGAATFFLVVLAFMDSCRSVPYILSFLIVAASTAFGIIASSMYIQLASYDVQHDGWQYNYSFGLFLAAWIINAFVTLIGLGTGAACGKTA